MINETTNHQQEGDWVTTKTASHSKTECLGNHREKDDVRVLCHENPKNNFVDNYKLMLGGVITKKILR